MPMIRRRRMRFTRRIIWPSCSSSETTNSRVFSAMTSSGMGADRIHVSATISASGREAMRRSQSVSSWTLWLLPPLRLRLRRVRRVDWYWPTCGRFSRKLSSYSGAGASGESAGDQIRRCRENRPAGASGWWGRARWRPAFRRGTQARHPPGAAGGSPGNDRPGTTRASAPPPRGALSFARRRHGTSAASIQHWARRRTFDFLRELTRVIARPSARGNQRMQERNTAAWRHLAPGSAPPPGAQTSPLPVSGDSRPKGRQPAVRLPEGWRSQQLAAFHGACGSTALDCSKLVGAFACGDWSPGV